MGDLDDQMAPVSGLIALIYKGLEVPNKCCTGESVAAPSGVSCVDAGRVVTIHQYDLTGMMKHLDEKRDSVVAGSSNAVSGSC